jgi:hypothetical protein
MGYQTLHRNRVVIKVAFRFVLKHDARRGQSKEGSFPSLHREISLGPSSDRIQKCMTMLQIVNLIRDSESHDRKIVVSLELTKYREAKGKACTQHCDGSSGVIFMRV